jgi:hypothetical protein
VETSSGSGLRYFAAWCLILLTVGLVLALFWQNFYVYFTLDPTPLQPTAADGTRWAWTASACVASAAAAVIVAAGSGSRGMRWSAAVTLVVALVASVVFIVPRDRWHHAPAPNELPPGYSPCYSGSNTCN